MIGGTHGTTQGEKFAKNDTEFTGSLFNPDATCVGYYRANGTSIALMDHQRNKVGVINFRGVLARADKQEDGRYWYSYGDIDIIGRYDSFMQSVEEPKDVLGQCGITRPACGI